ncbi:purine-nucleoside phosphorylase [Buchnera aphidicola (Thelaxes californica)]|uniref:Purine nucleoside phosphorylase DeoD-type n=1 Tax=Buchnera aphidicola (Thelaxes californica) TaxID=1315998 RepID=A0A4D6YLM4_9GAMM|nr:purine-nucleoside phosphorylase [Buchnera aphidicola]QCI26940.1 purine-nucleoside phosphorylase [Buchnera aphidicola (Thelaxes californica)]
MSTLHISAKKNDIAETVIMSGDPIRVKFITENYLVKYKLINNIRGMLGYTGFFKEKKISIMSHGMGIPSASIYIQELISNYNVKKIIRLGTCGTVLNTINLKDIIVSVSACTDSFANRLRFNNFDFSATANFDLLLKTYKVANKLGIKVHFGSLFTTDLFYSNFKKINSIMKIHNILGIDMETAGIYFLASKFGIQAISLCIVSDNINTGEKLLSEERVSYFNNIINIALEL